MTSCLMPSPSSINLLLDKYLVQAVRKGIKILEDLVPGHHAAQVSRTKLVVSLAQRIVQFSVGTPHWRWRSKEKKSGGRAEKEPDTQKSLLYVFANPTLGLC